MKVSLTYTVDIGAQNNYFEQDSTKKVYKSILQDYCSKHGFCFSYQDVDFVYKYGDETGLKITLINYPRFPKANIHEIDNIALEIAEELLNDGNQKRCSVITPLKTYMLENDKL